MQLTDFFSQPGNIIFLGFCIITLIQLFYYLFFFLRLAIHKTKAKNVSQTHPVSVIICSRDEAANLVKNLPGAFYSFLRSAINATACLYKVSARFTLRSKNLDRTNSSYILKMVLSYVSNGGLLTKKESSIF